MQFVEDLLEADMAHIARAYTRLVNANQQSESFDTAKALLRELKIRTRDLSGNLLKVLCEKNIPVAEIRNLNLLMKQQDCHHLFILAQHYTLRFLNSDQKNKMKCLTASYHALKDLADCVAATPIEHFYREIASF